MVLSLPLYGPEPLSGPEHLSGLDPLSGPEPLSVKLADIFFACLRAFTNQRQLVAQATAVRLVSKVGEAGGVSG